MIKAPSMEAEATSTTKLVDVLRFLLDRASSDLDALEQQRDGTRRVYEKAELDAAVEAAREECAKLANVHAASYLADCIRSLNVTGALDRLIAQSKKDVRVLQELVEDYQKAVDSTGRHHLISPENVRTRFDALNAGVYLTAICAICSYCDPKSWTHCPLDSTGRMHIDKTGSTYNCTSVKLRALTPADAQVALDRALAQARGQAQQEMRDAGFVHPNDAAQQLDSYLAAHPRLEGK